MIRDWLTAEHSPIDWAFEVRVVLGEGCFGLDDAWCQVLHFGAQGQCSLESVSELQEARALISEKDVQAHVYHQEEVDLGWIWTGSVVPVDQPSDLARYVSAFTPF